MRRLLIAAVVLLVACLAGRPVSAAVTVQAVSASGNCAICLSLTYSVTVSAGSNLFIVVSVHTNSNRTTDSVTYAGTNLTRAGRAASAGYVVEWWYLAGPATGANNVVITQPLLDNISSRTVIYEGVDQTTPVDTAATATGNSTAPSVAVTSASGDLVQDTVTHAFGAGDTLTVGADQTERYNDQVVSDIKQGGSTEPGAASVTMSWTISVGRIWGIVGTSINPAAGGGGAGGPVGYRNLLGVGQ